MSNFKGALEDGGKEFERTGEIANAAESLLEMAAAQSHMLNEIERAQADSVMLGTGFIVNGKRVAPEDVIVFKVDS